MKTLSLAVLVVLCLLAAPALAQRMPQGAEREAMIRQHIKECEVCAGLQAQIDQVQAELDELDAKREALELKRLEEKIQELVEAYPDAKEPLENLLALRKKLAELAKEMRETVASGRDILDKLELEPDDRAALVEAIGPIERLLPPDRRQGRFQTQRMMGGGPGRGGDRNPQADNRLQRMQEERKRQLEALKESDPEMYEIEVKDDELTKKLADLQAELRQSVFEHLRNAQQSN
jgi:DNA repair exonuclease SbcCD ATPase subunit